jgi:hypothetical protein
MRVRKEETSMENVQEYIMDEVSKGSTPADKIENNGVTLLRSRAVTGDVNATVKRSTKTRTVKVLAFEEWSDGVWVKHQAEFKNTEGKRQYTPRIRYSRPNQVVSIEAN